MNISKKTILIAGLFSLLPGLDNCLHADTFGTGANTFTIDFATIGNPGNGDDAGAGGGISSSPHGGVAYTYRMGVYEVSQDAITKATALGMTDVKAGAWEANRPAADIQWYEAAAFVNWLNTSTGHQPAYNLTYTDGWSMSPWSSEQAWQTGGENRYRHKDARYFLPSEDEWYKAAYHKNDGVTANYWDYATGGNTVPDGIDSTGDTSFGAVFDDGFNQTSPNEVTNVGIAGSYGTYAQNGNVWEWTESAYDGSNTLSNEVRAMRGGAWDSTEGAFRPSGRGGTDPDDANFFTGFRVASVFVAPTLTPVQAWLTNQSVPTNTPLTGDLDGDGHTVLVEYALGGSALARDSALTSVMTNAQNRLQISFLWNNAATDLTATVSASDDLVSWTAILEKTGSGPWIGSATFTDLSAGGDLRQILVTDPLAGDRRFLKLLISQPQP